jgi:alpha-methylacyl-CoA racemase
MPENNVEAKKQTRDIIKTKTKDEWMRIFSTVNACVEPVLSVQEALDDEQSHNLGIVADIYLPDGGNVRQPAILIKFSGYK